MVVAGVVWLLIIPLIVIDLGLLIYSLLDLTKPDRKVRGGSKLLWVLIILLFSTIGPLLYIFAGREE